MKNNACRVVILADMNKCCGCLACLNICPKEAIVCVQNEKGFNYPLIDASKCIECYKCVKICPINKYS